MKAMRLSKVLGWFAMGMTCACLPLPATAQVSENTPDYSDAAPSDFASEEIMKEVASGGVPLGRWKEGLLFEGISPQPWLTSAANWFPGHRGGSASRDEDHLHGDSADATPRPDEYVHLRGAG
jgi:hypothetical protein